MMNSRFATIAFALLLVLASGVASASGTKTQAEINKEAFFQGLNLVILLGAMVYFGRGPIKAFFASRRSEIKTHLSEASELLNQAEQRNADLQRKLVDLSSEVADIKSTASSRATDEASRIIADAQAAADRIRRDASAAVDQELRRAQDQLRKDAALVAVEMAETRLKAEVSEGDRDRLLDEFITRVEPTSSPSGGVN